MKRTAKASAVRSADLPKTHAVIVRIINFAGTSHCGNARTPALAHIRTAVWKYHAADRLKYTQSPQNDSGPIN